MTARGAFLPAGRRSTPSSLARSSGHGIARVLPKGHDGASYPVVRSRRPDRAQRSADAGSRYTPWPEDAKAGTLILAGVAHEGAGRDERIRLQGVAGELLSEGHQGEGHAPLLRDTAPERGDQQHVLSHAERDRAPGMGRAGPGRFHVRAEGAPAHHAPEEAEGGRVAGRALLREGGDAGSPTWPAAVP